MALKKKKGESEAQYLKRRQAEVANEKRRAADRTTYAKLGGAPGETRAQTKTRVADWKRKEATKKYEADEKKRRIAKFEASQKATEKPAKPTASQSAAARRASFTKHSPGLTALNKSMSQNRAPKKKKKKPTY